MLVVLLLASRLLLVLLVVKPVKVLGSRILDRILA